METCQCHCTASHHSTIRPPFLHDEHHPTHIITHLESRTHHATGPWLMSIRNEIKWPFLAFQARVKFSLWRTAGPMLLLLLSSLRWQRSPEEASLSWYLLGKQAGTHQHTHAHKQLCRLPWVCPQLLVRLTHPHCIPFACSQRKDTCPTGPYSFKVRHRWHVKLLPWQRLVG